MSSRYLIIPGLVNDAHGRLQLEVLVNHDVAMPQDTLVSTRDRILRISCDILVVLHARH